jgi:protein involved in polysaccharide export with SLBB domain
MRNFQIRILRVSFLLVSLSCPIHAQSVTYGQKPRAAIAAPVVPLEVAPEPRQAAQPERAINVSPNSPLAAGAEVSFLIVEENEPTRVIIADSGELEIPGGLGRVSVSGLTAAQASAKVKSYLEGQYYKPGKATVRIGINTLPASGQKKSKALVSGKLARGGAVEFYSSAPKTLSEAILEMGPTPWSKLTKVKVTRGDQSIDYDVSAILDGTMKDVYLQDGDRISVPEKGIRF